MYTLSFQNFTSRTLESPLAKDNLETIELSTKKFEQITMYLNSENSKAITKGKQDLCLLTQYIGLFLRKYNALPGGLLFWFIYPCMFYFLQHNYFLFLSIPLDGPFKQKYFYSLKQSSSLKCTKIKLLTSILNAHFCAQTNVNGF